MMNQPLYHWSPAENRAKIKRSGLKPSWLGVCLSESPSFAFGMCPHLHGEIDLWMTWSGDCVGLKRRKDTTGYPAEWRAKSVKEKPWFVGTRGKK